MAAEMKKEGAFDAACIRDIYDKLQFHNLGLRAFGELLRSSHLEDFAAYPDKDKDVKAQNLRNGLSQIINLYLDHQEKIVSEYVDLYNNSDEAVVLSIAGNIDMFEEGDWPSRETAADRLRKNIIDLDVVITRDGELKEEAAMLKEMCHKHLRNYMKMEPAQTKPSTTCASGQSQPVK